MYKEFERVYSQIKSEATNSESPILERWVQFFAIISEYLMDTENRDVVMKLEKFEDYCRSLNLRKMADEIQVYTKLISSSKVIEQSKDRFSKTAFLDVFNEESKKIVLEYLEN